MNYKSLDSKLLRFPQINQNHVVLSLKVLLSLYYFLLPLRARYHKISLRQKIVSRRRMIRVIERERERETPVRGIAREFSQQLFRTCPSESRTCVSAMQRTVARELTYNSACTHVTARFVISRLVEPRSHRRRAYNNSSAASSRGTIIIPECWASRRPLLSAGAYLIIRSIMNKLLIKRFRHSLRIPLATAATVCNRPLARRGFRRRNFETNNCKLPPLIRIVTLLNFHERRFLTQKERFCWEI